MLNGSTGYNYQTNTHVQLSKMHRNKELIMLTSGDTYVFHIYRHPLNFGEMILWHKKDRNIELKVTQQRIFRKSFSSKGEKGAQGGGGGVGGGITPAI